MAKNDLILLAGILEEYSRDPSFENAGETFEYFATEQILKDYAFSKDQLLSGSVDGRNDGGIDEFFVLVNGHLAESIPDDFWPKSNAELEVFIITCKHDSSFKQGPITTMIPSLIQLFDFSIATSALQESYNEKLLRKRDLLFSTYKRLASSLVKFDINIIYACRGNEEIESNIQAKAEQAQELCQDYFSDCTANFTFWGNSRLLSRYREKPNSSLDLIYEQCINQQGQYVVLANLKKYYDFIVNSVSRTLQQQEMIPDIDQDEVLNQTPKKEITERTAVPEPFEQKRMEEYKVKEDFSYITNRLFGEESSVPNIKTPVSAPDIQPPMPDIKAPVQMNFFEERILKQENKDKYEILGQIFQTYWLVCYEDKLLFVDQHAAHEKVKYEKLMNSLENGEILSQTLQPPLVLHLTQKEEAALEEYHSYFEALGFVWEDFGSHSIAMREMPMELYGKSEKHFFEEILDELVENGCKGTPEVIQEKIASMACKSAVKGNQTFTVMEMNSLLEQIFELENPYHCPHGRPTMISMSKTDLEKKFKRIV